MVSIAPAYSDLFRVASHYRMHGQTLQPTKFSSLGWAFTLSEPQWGVSSSLLPSHAPCFSAHIAKVSKPISTAPPKHYMHVIIGLTPRTAGAGCDDIKPPGNFTCSQQKDLGKCQAPWMTSGGFCKATCGSCTPRLAADASSSASPAPEPALAATPAQPPQPIPPAADPVTAALSVPPAVAPPPPAQPPAAEIYRSALNEAASQLAAPSANGPQPTVLPTIVLPDMAGAATTPTAADAPPVVPMPQPTTPLVAPIAPLTPPAVPLPVAAGAATPVASSLPTAPVAQSAGAQVSLPPAPEAGALACNASAPTALTVLQSNPDYSTTLKAVQALSLGPVLQNPAVEFTVREGRAESGALPGATGPGD